MIWNRNASKKPHAIYCLGVVVAICSVAICPFGCTPSKEPSSSTEIAEGGTQDPDFQAVDPQHRLIDPKIRLQQVFQRYQGSAFYEDNGEVVLEVQLPGKSAEQQRAPLKVRLDRDQLAVDAYAARVRVTRHSDSTSELIAWFDEPQTSNFDSQVLMNRWESQPGVRLDLDQVLQDEILRSRLSAGLAGPPPQMDWLLASSPMEKLFTEDADFQWLKTDDSASSQTIEVRSDGRRYIFSIDPVTSLIRQVELPLPIVQQSLVDGDRELNISVTVVLSGATFQKGGTPQSPNFAGSPNFEPIRVRQFIAIPPSPPSALLGRTIDTRILQTALSQTSSQIPIDRWLVLCAPVDATILSGWLAVWKPCLQAIDHSLGDRVPVLVVADDRRIARSLQTSLSDLATVAAPDDASRLIRVLRQAPGSMTMLSESGKILLSQESTVNSTAATSLAALRDSLNGIDVPARVRADYDRLQQDYQSALKQVVW